MNKLQGLSPRLLVLLVLLTGCAHNSPLSKPPPQPAIPPLPAQARQVDSPTFLRSAWTDIEQWQLLLIEPLLQDAPAKESTIP